MTTKENIIAILKSHKAELSKFGVSALGLFVLICVMNNQLKVTLIC